MPVRLALDASTDKVRMQIASRGTAAKTETPA